MSSAAERSVSVSFVVCAVECRSLICGGDRLCVSFVVCAGKCRSLVCGGDRLLLVCGGRFVPLALGSEYSSLVCVGERRSVVWGDFALPCVLCTAGLIAPLGIELVAFNC
jgi:hypothetical protein